MEMITSDSIFRVSVMIRSLFHFLRVCGAETPAKDQFGNRVE